MKHALLLLALAACGGPEQPEPLPPTEQPPQALTGLPCDVHEALQNNCAKCHVGGTLIPGFATRDDLLSFGVRISERMATANSPMPPRAADRQPTDAERALIARWVEQGMPAGECGALR